MRTSIENWDADSKNKLEQEKRYGYFICKFLLVQFIDDTDKVFAVY